MTSRPPKCSAKRDDAERDRHPRLDPRRRILLGRDRARSGPVRSSRRRYRTGLRPALWRRAAASSRSRPASPRSRDRSPRAGCRSRWRRGRESCRHWPRRGRPRSRSAAGGWALRWRILSLQMLERRDGAVDRRLADGTGRGNALAEPDDPRKRIDHAKTVAGRTGDQKPAIIGAKVERGIDTVCCVPPQPTLTGLRRPQGLRAAAYRHSSKLSFRGRFRAAEEITVHGNFSSAKGLRNNPSHRTMPNQALSGVMRCVI